MLAESCLDLVDEESISLFPMAAFVPTTTIPIYVAKISPTHSRRSYATDKSSFEWPHESLPEARWVALKALDLLQPHNTTSRQTAYAIPSGCMEEILHLVMPGGPSTRTSYSVDPPKTDEHTRPTPDSTAFAHISPTISRHSLPKYGVTNLCHYYGTHCDTLAA